MFFKKKKQIKHYLELTNYEYHLILDALIRTRDKLIAEGRFTDGIDETILAIAR